MKDRGCLFWACIGCGGITVFAIIIVIVLGVFAKRSFDRVIEAYTADEAIEIPVLQLTDEQAEAMAQRHQALHDGLTSGNGKTYILTADDLNNWIMEEEDLGLVGNLYVYIEGELITADASIPLDGLLGLTDRYLNGKIEFTFDYRHGALQVYTKEIFVNEELLPEKFLELMRWNLAEDLNADPEFEEWMNNVELIEVRDGKIYLTVKSAGTPEE
ncbi:MAG: hypothetical protein QGF67_17195 [Lentisphaeria bacterium]|nr:hypothetical protein [Lentisphaeria bacterium]MDP7743178.1 hypothetical protein [Lentisphaeria bacterium]